MDGKQYVDTDNYEDKDIEASLFGKEENIELLNDDFIWQANGGVPVDVQKAMDRLNKNVALLKINRKSKKSGADVGHEEADDDDEDVDFDDDYDFDDDGFDVDEFKYRLNLGQNGEQDGTEDGERKPRLIDEQFDHMLGQYDDNDIGELNARDPMVMGAGVAKPEDPEFQEYIQYRQRQKALRSVRQPSSFANLDKVALEEKEKMQEVPEIERQESSGSDFDESILANLYPPKKFDDTFDCESIITTYSNLENHPKLIVEPKNKIKISSKTGIPLGVLTGKSSGGGAVNQKQAKADLDVDGEAPEKIHAHIQQARPEDETPEERKMRKKALKETRRAAREKNKMVKKAYKAEEIRQTNILVSQRVEQRVVYKF